MHVSIYSSALLLLCLLAPPVHADDGVRTILDEARAIDNQANALQGAWVTTEQLIKNAEQALKKGDTKTALHLAKKARTEAQLSLSQAKDQQKNWAEPPYIRQSRH
jgi:Rad3-related DNA helicase